MKRSGLVKKRRQKVRTTKQGTELQNFDHPNSIWCVDFKGEFWTGDQRCYPLTITDGYSRYLISCEALKRPSYELSKPIFEKAFKEYGLPKTIRSDNGAPFSSLAPGGLSKLSVWWIKLGILPERIEPGHPEQNGGHERMHRTLKAETANPPTKSFKGQQRRFNKFMTEYNFERPHESLDMDVPKNKYKYSLRPYPKDVPEITYPEHFKVIRTDKTGKIYFNRNLWRISSCINKENIGLEECENNCWRVYFGSFKLGIIDLKKTNGTCQTLSIIRYDGKLGKNIITTT